MRRLKGTVISHKTKKTAVVRVDRLVKHEKYRKFYRSSRKFKAHDPEDGSKVGDVVVIEESRPLSKDKRWRIVELVSREPSAEGDEGNEKGEQL
ncbi:MAG: 30S ribosomal protein S17 [Candidatus Sungbacteria bacterium RIFCSPHIGHO2_01_FULL_50_25]|uniref:Small ribosomal subunit protein uS17 n=1 Tax=Candidatus Sungbacteria bacterium RIFCSPHIGHO2_01_FULL_50_25 TaxID=1802265 RepID=A0A1G2K7W6_9BACT|nr:MAG: 30S ribosomal protein S17 [Candidatus Sungbacteria bacterium RIFCSPHIGHO2_01_FULL_50_25]